MKLKFLDESEIFKKIFFLPRIGWSDIVVSVVIESRV